MLSRSLRRLLLVGCAALLPLSAVAACDDDPATSGGARVVAGFYPLQFVAEHVGGAHVSVTSPTKPGTEPHDLELTPTQIGRLADADLVLHLKGFQPELDEAVEQNNADRALDVATVTPLSVAAAHGDDTEQAGLDPHVWLDPTRLAVIGDAVARRLAGIDPAHAADYTAGAAALHERLTALDSEFAAGLKTCQRREIVTSHAAFGYLANRYQLEQVALTGLSPESEPAPQRLTDVAKQAREHEATTIFFETLVSPKVAETLAKEVGARTAVLDPIEGPSSDSTQDYFSVMRSNLETLRTALGCS